MIDNASAHALFPRMEPIIAQVNTRTEKRPRRERRAGAVVSELQLVGPWGGRPAGVLALRYEAAFSRDLFRSWRALAKPQSRHFR